MRDPVQLEFDFIREVKPEPTTLKDVAVGFAALKIAVERSPVAVALGCLMEKSGNSMANIGPL